MITLEDGVLVLNRLADGDNILPVLQRAKGKQKEAWFVLIQVANEAVLHWLLDAQIMEEEFPVRYIARNGDTGDAVARIDELVTAETGTQCRLIGAGAPPAALTADEPEMV